MRTAFVSIGLSVLFTTIPLAVLAAPNLRDIMRVWRVDARATDAMLSGRIAFDQKAIRDALEMYAGNAGSIAAQVTGQTASARDFKRRLLAFQADAQAALGETNHQSTLRADFSRITSDCRSCHDAFNK